MIKKSVSWYCLHKEDLCLSKSFSFLPTLKLEKLLLDWDSKSTLRSAYDHWDETLHEPPCIHWIWATEILLHCSLFLAFGSRNQDIFCPKLFEIYEFSEGESILWMEIQDLDILHIKWNSLLWQLRKLDWGLCTKLEILQIPEILDIVRHCHYGFLLYLLAIFVCLLWYSEILCTLYTAFSHWVLRGPFV